MAEMMQERHQLKETLSKVSPWVSLSDVLDWGLNVLGADRNNHSAIISHLRLDAAACGLLQEEDGEMQEPVSQAVEPAALRFGEASPLQSPRGGRVRVFSMGI